MVVVVVVVVLLWILSVCIYTLRMKGVVEVLPFGPRNVNRPNFYLFIYLLGPTDVGAMRRPRPRPTGPLSVRQLDPRPRVAAPTAVLEGDLDRDGRDLWIYGFMDLWIYGFMDLWIYGFKSINPYMDLWIYGFKSIF